MQMITRTLILTFSLLLLTLTACDRSEDASDDSANAPTSSAETNDTRVADPHDWCGGHDIPESMCTKCNSELIEKFKAEGDWCAEHGFPESACPQCNPISPPSSRAEHNHDHAPAAE